MQTAKELRALIVAHDKGKGTETYVPCQCKNCKSNRSKLIALTEPSFNNEENKMRSAYELLISAPDEQKMRAKIACKAAMAGDWLNAAFTLRNAANESTGQWAEDAHEIAEYYEQMAENSKENQRKG